VLRLLTPQARARKDDDLSLPRALFVASLLCLAGPVGLRAQQAATDQPSFTADNAKAMVRMMADMAVKPTGDVDADFVAMMVAHHQGAIDMARAELRYGKNKKLRRMARQIVTEQTAEIADMRAALGRPAPTATPAAAAPAHDHSSMSPGGSPKN
jgi:hypothetical protein